MTQPTPPQPVTNIAALVDAVATTRAAHMEATAACLVPEQAWSAALVEWGINDPQRQRRQPRLSPKTLPISPGGPAIPAVPLGPQADLTGLATALVTARAAMVTARAAYVAATRAYQQALTQLGAA